MRSYQLVGAAALLVKAASVAQGLADSPVDCSLKSAPKRPFSDADVANIRKYFEANLDVQGSGMVVASPDHALHYDYAWTRDGALCMHALQLTTKNLTAIEGKMDSWMSWVERSLDEPDPNAGTIALNEPKFTIPDGKPYTGPWCRPQNDGPGLRAITLMAYAHTRKEAVRQRAWTVVERELDWIVANYTSNGCDLWEEVQSNDFFWVRYTMRKALYQGSVFAETIANDIRRAASYKKKADEITQNLSRHITNDGWVFESENRKVDTAVIEAFNVGDMDDGMFAPLSHEVVRTLAELSRAFCGAFQLNQETAKADMPGVLFGRYPGDSYFGGNPWILLSASAATLLYRQAKALSNGATIEPATETVLEGLLGQKVAVSSLLGGGDAILNLVRKYLTNGMHMNEQIDRKSGELRSATDLTWNYANVLKAMHVRDSVSDLIPATVVV